MPFFLFLYLRGKEKERMAKKEKENTQLFSTLSHTFERAGVIANETEQSVVAGQPALLRVLLLLRNTDSEIIASVWQ